MPPLLFFFAGTRRNNGCTVAQQACAFRYYNIARLQSRFDNVFIAVIDFKHLNRCRNRLAVDNLIGKNAVLYLVSCTLRNYNALLALVRYYNVCLSAAHKPPVVIAENSTHADSAGRLVNDAAYDVYPSFLRID